MRHRRTWSLISLPVEARQYRGNIGYDDDARAVYRYDSSVPNHRQLAEGDLVLIRDSSRLLGVAIVERITTSQITKQRLRCPVCETTNIKERKTAEKPWRCGPKQHEFNNPLVEEIPVTGYEAHYRQSFIDTPDAVSLASLKDAAPRPNDQLSIEEISLASVETELKNNAPQAGTLIERFFWSVVPDPMAADGDQSDLIHPGEEGAFNGTSADTRERVLKSIYLRRGQGAFRRKLVRRYGACCMATGCELMDVVEAAHIDPYRGKSDNHVDNGLLLRADLHTLFDLNLMSIDPDRLVLRFHETALSAGYDKLEGLRLMVGSKRPAREPLERRWEMFRKQVRT